VTAASEERFTVSYPVLGGGFFLAGRAAAETKRRLREAGLAAELVRRVVVATYEAEMNICIHAVSGRIHLRVENDRVKVVATDRGAGIADIAQALRPGFSTASEKARQLGFGAGMGFANMQRCADSFRITSEVGCGTTVTMEFWPRPQTEETGP